MKAIKNKKVLPAMTREEWKALPEVVKYFLPWKRARRPAIIKTVQPPDKAKRAK
jgi:hypothetical protein